MSDVDPYQRVDVIFTGGRYVPKAEREVFAHDNGLEEIYVMLRFREWPGTYTAVFEYVIRDGRHPDAKVRDLLALPDVQEAYRPGLGGYGELVDVVTAAVTAPPEYSEDGFLPELWIRFKQPMSDLDVELFGVRYLLTQSGQRGDWYRFCEEGSVFPEQEREAVLTWPEVADVRFEVGKP